jgi:hypothetical protein
MLRGRDPFCHFRLELLQRHSAKGGRENRKEILYRQLLYGLAVPGQYGLERFDIFQLGLLGYYGRDPSRQYTICVYIGCETHSVPSWSKVARRAFGGTNFGFAGSVVACRPWQQSS